jgi:L,D-transpeptidase ErfK/SrfK
MGHRIVAASALLAWFMLPLLATSGDSHALITGNRIEHVVQRDETLSSLGARFGIEPRVLARLNDIASDTPLRAGQPLVIDTRHIVPASAGEDLLINIPQRMLFVFSEDPAVSGYPVAVGRATWPTFTGPFVVAMLELNPVWDVPPSIQDEQRRTGKPMITRVLPGPANPLGDYWIGLSRPGFGIHSTNAPLSIYTSTTHGCIRLHPDDAKAVFAAAFVGMRGLMAYEPILLAQVSDGRVLLEAHPDVYRRQRDPLSAVRGLAAQLAVTPLIDWAAVSAVVRRRDGTPEDVTRR